MGYPRSGASVCDADTGFAKVHIHNARHLVSRLAGGGNRLSGPGRRRVDPVPTKRPVAAHISLWLRPRGSFWSLSLIASLFTGVVLSLGTTWELFRHYWIVAKLGITVFATVILMIYMGTFREMAGVAADPVVELGLVRNPSPLVHSILALILLIAATLLGIYKPFGETPYGRRTPATPSRLGSGDCDRRGECAGLGLLDLDCRHRPCRALYRRTFNERWPWLVRCSSRGTEVTTENNIWIRGDV